MRFLVIVLACAFIVGCDTESPEYDDIDYANDIYGVAVDFGDPVFEHSPKRDFNGDGVSLHLSLIHI